MSWPVLLITVILILLLILFERVEIKIKLFGELKIDVNFVFLGIIFSSNNENKSEQEKKIISLKTKKNRARFFISAIKSLYDKCDFSLPTNNDYSFSASIYLYHIFLFIIQYSFNNLKRRLRRKIYDE